MRTTASLWFPIEEFFSEVMQMCTEARAAELVARKRASLGDPLDLTGAPPATRMTIEEVATTARFPGALALANDGSFQAKVTRGADVVALRARIRKLLDGLRAQLKEVLNEREVYYTLFPVVIHCDELLHEVTESAAQWEPLERELRREASEERAEGGVPLQYALYEVDNGGEVFYAVIDNLLRKEDTDPLIFQIFYYCLSDGFKGMYAEDPHLRDEYMNKLAARIPVEKPDEGGTPGIAAGPVIRLFDFPVRYYAAAAGVVLVVFGLLRFLSHQAIASVP